MKRIISLIFAISITSGAVAADEAMLRSCQDTLKKSQKLSMLVNIKVKTGHFDVIVGPTFYSVPFDTKVTFAEKLNCVFNVGDTGPQSACNDIRFINWRTGNEDGKYSWCKLKIY